MALCIENDAELLGAETALAKVIFSQSQGDHSRLASPRKMEASLLRDNRDWKDDHYMQESGGHYHKRKVKSRARFEEWIQPALPLATPATPMAAGPLLTL